MFRTRADCNSTMVSTFEIIAMYYVNLFVNQLYGIARKHKAAKGGDMSLTDMYQEVVMAYVYGAQHESEHFRSVVGDLHRMFAQTPKFASIGISEFVDRVIEFFIPPSYLANFTSNDRTELFQTIIISTFLEFQKIVLNTNRIGFIIDQRSEKSARQFQDDIIDILVMQRDNFFNTFMSQIGQCTDVISVRRQDYDRLRGTIVDLIRQKHELEEQLEHAGIKVKKAKSTVSKSSSRRSNRASSVASLAPSSIAHDPRSMGGKLSAHLGNRSNGNHGGAASAAMHSIHEEDPAVIDANIHADDSVSNVGGRGGVSAFSKKQALNISGFNPGVQPGMSIMGGGKTNISVGKSTISSSYFSDDDDSTEVTSTTGGGTNTVSRDAASSLMA
jgi:hypothetical protein